MRLGDTGSARKSLSVSAIGRIRSAARAPRSAAPASARGYDGSGVESGRSRQESGARRDGVRQCPAEPTRERSAPAVRE